jgi:hypothetical protein
MTIDSDEWTATRKSHLFELRRCPCDSPEAYLLIGNRSRDFSLRLRQLFGEEIISLQFTTEGCKHHKYRKVAAHFFSEGCKHLESVRPRIGALGNWSLDLGGRFAMPSHKNARLEGELTGPIYIRKYRSGGLEVQTADRTIIPVCLFGLAIASFAAKK